MSRLTALRSLILCSSLLAAFVPAHYAQASRASWPTASELRLKVVVDPGTVHRINAPAGVAIDFRDIFIKNNLPGRVDLSSIRVFRPPDENNRRRALASEVPYQLSGDFPNDDRGVIWWRMRNNADTTFFVYFDRLQKVRQSPQQTLGLIGVGDNLYYNDGKPGFAGNIALHSTYHCLDWDGDGLPDLIGFGYRAYEYGMPLEPDLGNWVYFYKNIGTAQSPIFAPRQRVKGEDGNYLTMKRLPMDMFPADWDGDRDTDFFGVDGTKLLLFENSGKRDRNGLWLLKQPRQVGDLKAESEFRKTLPVMVSKTRGFSFRGARMVDWEGDGDLDLIVDYRRTERFGDVNPRRGIFPYGTTLLIFEVWRNEGKNRDGNPVFGAPEIIREERGLPITSITTAPGGAEYIDYDADGDLDLLYQDDTTRPLEGGRLMFSENVGTRKNPLFLKGFDILKIYPSQPSFVDWNGDGRFDLIAGGEFFENVNPKSGRPDGIKENATPLGTYVPRPDRLPRFVSRGLAQTPNPKIMTWFTDSADWDGDGDLDLISGYYTNLHLLTNKGTTLSPVFERPVRLKAGGKEISLPNWIDPQADEPSHWGPQGPSEPEYGWVVPTVQDFDNDGDLDVFVTSQRWQVKYFENSGTRKNAKLARGREVKYRGNPHEFSWRSRVSVGDLDGDGKAEFVVTSNQDNVFYMYHPTKVQKDPNVLDVDRGAALVLEDGTPMQGWYGTQNNNGDNHSQLVDWDGDGDLDLINGSIRTLLYYENVGTTRKPVFRKGTSLMAGGQVIHTFNHAGSFDAADWNDDGRMDLLTSTECPSDQPMGNILHLFDRSFIENNLPSARVEALERKHAAQLLGRGRDSHGK